MQTKSPDIHRIDEREAKAYLILKNSKLLEDNKAILLEFLSDLKTQWAGNQPVGKHRLVKYYEVLRALTEILESLDDRPLNWSYCQKNHIRGILIKIDNKKSWGDWSKQGARQMLKKFITWIRTTHGYPIGYPEANKLNAAILKVPPEVDFANFRPRRLKPISEIPVEWEVNSLIKAWDIYRIETCREHMAARNQAIMAVISEVGLRIGGLGNRIIKDVVFDNLGALMSISDKTMIGQSVRLITSVPYLKEWLKLHPDKDNLDAPLWVSLMNESGKQGEPMSYENFRKILIRSRKIYNEYAKKQGLPQITRRLHFHAFRYHRQTQDMLEGMPLSIQCRQRGWSPTSGQPMLYARLSTQEQDQWLAARHGLSDKIGEA